MRRVLVARAACLAALGFVTTVSAAETATTSVVVSARFCSRTSLQVSTDVLRFDLPISGQTGTSVVDFSAGVRTHSGAEVLLSVEPLRRDMGPAGSRDAESVSFAGQGNGTLEGVLDAASPAVAARWIGSGLRQGRLVFRMRATAAGTYFVPVRFILSAP